MYRNPLHVSIHKQGRSSRILIDPADYPPPMGEVWFLGLGGLSARPEGPKREARRAKSGVGFLGRGQRAPPHQLGGLGERCELPQRGPGHSPGRKRIFDVEDPIERIWW